MGCSARSRKPRTSWASGARATTHAARDAVRGISPRGSPRATRGPAHTRGPSAAGEREVNVALKGNLNKGESEFGSDALPVQKKLESAKNLRW